MIEVVEMEGGMVEERDVSVLSVTVIQRARRFRGARCLIMCWERSCGIH